MTPTRRRSCDERSLKEIKEIEKSSGDAGGFGSFLICQDRNEGLRQTLIEETTTRSRRKKIKKKRKEKLGPGSTFLKGSAER